MSSVSCIDLCKTYHQGDQDIKALDHVNLEITRDQERWLRLPVRTVGRRQDNLVERDRWTRHAR
jgi:hypothetical protein